MKNKLKIVAIICIILILIIGVIILINKRSTSTTKGNEEIELGKSEYIKQLTDIKIKGTDDTIKITKFVKWEVPDAPEGATVSFAIAIPYTFVVDGKEYSGTYELNDAETSIKDNNPKYNFSVRDLTKDGNIKILVNKK